MLLWISHSLPTKPLKLDVGLQIQRTSRLQIPQTMEHEGIVNEFSMILPNAGILPFDNLEGTSELDEVYQRVLPFETELGTIFQNGELRSKI